MYQILLIEDNDEMRENTAELLELSDFKVITAKNGKEGVEKAKSNASNLDLILCDIMMPELDGYGVLHIVGKNEETAKIPFVFLTAKTEKEDFRKGMNMGADDYLLKPFTELELLNAIEKRIARTKHFKDETSNLLSLHEQSTEIGLKKLKELFREKRNSTYKKKDTIFHEGDFSNYIYLIESGVVKLFKINNDGKELIIDLHCEGSIFDLQTIFSNMDNGSTAQVIEDTSVFILPKAELIEAINTTPEITHYLLSLYTNSNIETNLKLLNMAYDSVRKRVADGILYFHEKYKELTIPISREDLSSIVGTSTESVIRTLHDFKEEKLLDIKGRKIEILDIKSLQNVRS